MEAGNEGLEDEFAKGDFENDDDINDEEIFYDKLLIKG